LGAVVGYELADCIGGTLIEDVVEAALEDFMDDPEDFFIEDVLAEDFLVEEFLAEDFFITAFDEDFEVDFPDLDFPY